MKPIKWIAVLVLSAMIAVTGIQTRTPSLADSTIQNEYMTHVVAACDIEPNQVEVRIQNLMATDVVINGEIWAQPDGGQPTLIASVPPQYQLVTPGNWGGPETRIADWFPNGFTGTVWGWATISTTGGTKLGEVQLSSTPMDCGHGNSRPVIEFGGHVVAACDIEPNQVEVRIQNLMATDVVINGEIWAQPDGGQPTLIASVPPQYQLVTPGNWGGPETRIADWFPNGFTGTVWGWATISTTGGTKLGEVQLSSTRLECGRGTTTYQTFLPFVAKAKSNLPTECAQLALLVEPPGSPASLRYFGEIPGPVYAFGDAFHAGSTLRFTMANGLPADSSTLSWYNLYTRSTGPGPQWQFTATSFSGEHPLLGILYTWQVRQNLANGKQCSIAFLMQWDP